MLACPTCHAVRTESEIMIEYEAGLAILVVSLPATWLFQPSHTAL
jgi:hypothetical protein